MMAEDNTEFMTTEPSEPPTIMMSIPPAPTVSRALTPVPELIEPTLLVTEPLVPTTADQVAALADQGVPFADQVAALADQVVPFADQVAPFAEQVVPLAEQVAALLPVVAKSKVDLLFTALSTNTIILSTVHNIKSRGKLETSDIPVLMLGIYNEYQNNNKKVVLTIDDLQILIERVYNYLVDKYTLIDPENQAVCFLMFTSALKLLLAVPAVKNKKCFFTCF